MRTYVVADAAYHVLASQKPCCVAVVVTWLWCLLPVLNGSDSLESSSWTTLCQTSALSFLQTPSVSPNSPTPLSANPSVVAATKHALMSK